ncbi:uncharacterized protein LOC117124142 [Anneissia japonica]|uniref:uncharacterized protein LOC117124142 n=1 Tax=Anneissia japonica TaxID=1529436 RepID=UPI0014255E60|nr:uncharacterized protein LOC117124142 [Anneissia japonica]
MNWVGGVRKRVRAKEEKRIQKEYFEKKKFMNQLNRVCDASPSKNRVAISQDLLSIQTVNHLHKTSQGKSLQKNSKRVKHVDLERIYDPFVNYRRRERNLELPMSPIETPSKLELQDCHVPRATKSDHICSDILSENTSTNNFSQISQLQARHSVYKDAQQTDDSQNLMKYSSYSQPNTSNGLIRSLFDESTQMENRNTRSYVGEARSTTHRKEDHSVPSPWPGPNLSSSHLSSPEILFQREVFKNSTPLPREQEVSRFLKGVIIPKVNKCNTIGRSSYSNAVPSSTSSLRGFSSLVDTDPTKSTRLPSLASQDNLTPNPQLEPFNFREHKFPNDFENDNQCWPQVTWIEHKPTNIFLKQENGSVFQTREGSVDLSSKNKTHCGFAQESNMNYESHLSMVLNQANRDRQVVPSEEHFQMPGPSLKHDRPTSPGTCQWKGVELQISQRTVDTRKQEQYKEGSFNNFGSTAEIDSNLGWRSFIFDTDGQNMSSQSHDDVQKETTRLKMNTITNEVVRELLSLDDELMDGITTQQIDDTALDRDFSALSSTQSSYVNDYYKECFTIKGNLSSQGSSTNVSADNDLNKALEELNTPVLKMNQTANSTDDPISDQLNENKEGSVEGNLQHGSCDNSPQFYSAEEVPANRIDCSTQTTGGHCTTCKCLSPTDVQSVEKSKPQQIVVQTLCPDLVSLQEPTENHTEILTESSLNDSIQSQLKQYICHVQPSNNTDIEDCGAGYHDSQLVSEDNKENRCPKCQSMENENNSVRYSLRTRNVNK